MIKLITKRRRCDIDTSSYAVFSVGSLVYYAFPRVWRGLTPITNFDDVSDAFTQVDTADEVLSKPNSIFLPKVWARPWASPDEDDPRDLVVISGDFTKYGGPMVDTHTWRGRLAEPHWDFAAGHLSVEGWAVTSAMANAVARAELTVQRAVRFDSEASDIGMLLCKEYKFDIEIPWPVQMYGSVNAVVEGAEVDENGHHTGYAQGARRAILTGGDVESHTGQHTVRTAAYVSSWDALEGVISGGIITREPWSI